MGELERLALAEALEVLERAGGHISQMCGSQEKQDRVKAAEKLTGKRDRAIALIKAVLLTAPHRSDVARPRARWACAQWLVDFLCVTRL
jgi:hypothetical protein